MSYSVKWHSVYCIVLRSIYFDVKVPTFPVQYYIQASKEQDHVLHSWNPCINGFRVILS